MSHRGPDFASSEYLATSDHGPSRGRFVAYPHITADGQVLEIQRIGVVLSTDALAEFPYRLVVPVLPALESLGRSPLSVAVRISRAGRGTGRLVARLLVNIEQVFLPKKMTSDDEVSKWEQDEEIGLLLVPERMVSCAGRTLVDLGLSLSRQSMAELTAATSILLQLHGGRH